MIHPGAVIARPAKKTVIGARRAPPQKSGSGGADAIRPKPIFVTQVVGWADDFSAHLLMIAPSRHKNRQQET